MTITYDNYITSTKTFFVSEQDCQITVYLEEDKIIVPDENGKVTIDDVIYKCYDDHAVVCDTASSLIGNNVTLLDEVCGLPVTEIGEYAFAACFLKSINIPNSIINIENNAFRNCDSLKSITIPDSVTSIKENAFDSCYKLASVTIPNSVISIENYAFYACKNLTSITIPNSVKSIGAYAFEYCNSLISVMIFDSVTERRKYHI